jgi:hypothetical protein
MTITFSELDNALAHLTCATRYGIIHDDITREHVEAAQAILRDYTRAGNLSPDYLLRQDQERRAEEVR